MRTSLDRFNSLYDQAIGYAKKAKLPAAYELSSRLDIKSGTYMSPDFTQQIAVRSIRFALTTLFKHKPGIESRFIDQIELRCNAAGEVIPIFTENMAIRYTSPEYNYAYPTWELEVPEENKSIALESAFVAIEQVLYPHNDYPPHAVA